MDRVWQTVSNVSKTLCSPPAGSSCVGAGVAVGRTIGSPGCLRWFMDKRDLKAARITARGNGRFLPLPPACLPQVGFLLLCTVFFLFFGMASHAPGALAAWTTADVRRAAPL